MIFASTNPLLNILAITFTAILVLILIAYLITNLIYNFVFGKRLDKTPLHFFTKEDFVGLNSTPIEFKTTDNNTLRGYIYYYDYDSYKGLMILPHGLGVGHLQYTNEINHFAKLGFKVFAYDNTGCATSDGKNVNGLPQGIIDLKSCLEFIKTRDDLKDYKKVLFGHSWGGYTSINILPFVNEEDNIKCVVSMGAPFNSCEIMYELITERSKLLSFTGPFLSIIENKRFGQISKMNTLASLENTNIDTMLVHGTKDHVVKYETNFKFVEDNFTKEHVKFITVENKRHRPNISFEATKYDEQIRNDVNKLGRNEEKIKNYYDNIDYKKLVEFDFEVMNTIDEFILNHFN